MCKVYCKSTCLNFAHLIGNANTNKQTIALETTVLVDKLLCTICTGTNTCFVES